MPDRTCVLRTVRASRRAVSAAGGAVAAHRAPNSAVLSIEGARTYAHATSRGVVEGFCAFRAVRSEKNSSRKNSNETSPTLFSVICVTVSL